jgi:NTP pyrophosphatase (non-canonical NTP hydrolase)
MSADQISDARRTPERQRDSGLVINWQRKIFNRTMAWAGIGKWVFPTPLKSLCFIVTEVGETIDAYLRTDGDSGFIRNNPGDPEESWQEELANIVFQCYVTAISAEFDLDELIEKKLNEMDRKRQL